MSRVTSAVRDAAFRLRQAGAAVLLALGLLFAAAPMVRAEPAQSNAPAPSAAQKLQQIRDLLADPEVQALLTRTSHGVQEAPAPVAPAAPMAVGMADRLQAFRAHLLALVAELPNLRSQTQSARSMVGAALDEDGWRPVRIYFLVFVGLGYAVEWLFRWAMRPGQRWLLKLTLGSVSERVRAVCVRFVYGFGLVVCFGLGSVGAFLLFDWPSALKEILLGYLIAFLGVRLIAVVGRILLAPGASRFRVVPITTPGAAFIFRRWIVLAALIGFGWQTISTFGRFGLSPVSRELCGDLIGLIVLIIGLDAVWRAPMMRLTAAPQTKADEFADRHRVALKLARSCLFIVLWCLWAADAEEIFWLLAFAATLPPVIVLARDSVNHVLRPPGSSISMADAKTVDVIVFERGVRALILIGAALLLATILRVDLGSLTMQDTLANRIVRGTVSIVVIALCADFLWNVTKALVDRKLAENIARRDSEDAAHAARVQTLLPIVSNILLIVIVVVGVMMALASAGIEIGPLIASAGVVGVAIGFGAQTLVRDVISGIFYLFDDAFRIGEYIQSGSYKGTVESFSLRSVKLRHQRGALYTVPFGILGAVQNQSRDWVVDKIVMNVPYGTDLEKVRKLIKGIGETLAEDEEFGADIIKPLKMQGVVQFGDFAIQIQTKMMTKPGDAQFMGRRRALLLINQAFSENGIGFAVPTVQVAGDAPVNGAAAHVSLDRLKAEKVE